MKNAFTKGQQVLAGCVIVGLAITALPTTAQAVAFPQPATAAPKNIIMLISDGAGYNQFDIANLFETGTARNQVKVDTTTGAVENLRGPAVQVYDSYPVQVGSSHYSASGRASYGTEEAWSEFPWVASGATDSAAAGTALGTGVKTNNGVLGHDAAGNRLTTIGEHARDLGKKVGTVTSVTFNHATPAGFIAHNANRNDYHGLAKEMIDSNIDVIIGAGHPNYTDDNTARAPHFGAGSWISEADFTRVSQGQTPFTYVEEKAGFEDIAAGTNVPEKLFGLPQVAETLQYNRAGLANKDVLPGTDPYNANIPGLDTLAKSAINVLKQDQDGFFLMVEGGAVDWAGHANQTTRVIEEQQDFNRAVEAVNDWVEAESSWDETLVIVTADHETGYLAGAGANPNWTPMTGNAGELPTVSWHSGGHTNALVPVFAKGAGSEQLKNRANKWDHVRGAYLDNTDIGEVFFDLFGHNDSAQNSADIPLNVSLPATGNPGFLSLNIADYQGVVRFDTAGTAPTAKLPELKVTDTRTEVTARGNGWTLSGQATDFVAGNRVIGADNLGWTPAIVASENGASAGSATTGLAVPSVLAQSDRLTRVGVTTVGADLRLNVPADAQAGNYASSITVSLFPRD